jgi:hypothetical protein
MCGQGRARALPRSSAFAFVVTHLVDEGFKDAVVDAVVRARAKTGRDIFVLAPPPRLPRSALDDGGGGGGGSKGSGSESSGSESSGSESSGSDSSGSVSSGSDSSGGSELVPDPLVRPDLLASLAAAVAEVPRARLVRASAWPVLPTQLERRHAAILRREKNAGGWREFLKLALWDPTTWTLARQGPASARGSTPAARDSDALRGYDRVLYLDHDVTLLRSVDAALECDARDATTLYTKGAMSPLNGGFLVLTPDARAYAEMRALLGGSPPPTRDGDGFPGPPFAKRATYTHAGYWDSTRATSPELARVPARLRKVHHGAEGFQGFFYFYFVLRDGRSERGGRATEPGFSAATGPGGTGTEERARARALHPCLYNVQQTTGRKGDGPARSGVARSGVARSRTSRCGCARIWRAYEPPYAAHKHGDALRAWLRRPAAAVDAECAKDL